MTDIFTRYELLSKHFLLFKNFVWKREGRISGGWGLEPMALVCRLHTCSITEFSHQSQHLQISSGLYDVCCVVCFPEIRPHIQECPQTCYVADNDLVSLIFLTWPSSFWDKRYVLMSFDEKSVIIHPPTHTCMSSSPLSSLKTFLLAGIITSSA